MGLITPPGRPVNFIRRYLINRRLRATMRPDPDYAWNRARQLPKERGERFLRNVGLIT